MITPSCVISINTKVGIKFDLIQNKFYLEKLGSMADSFWHTFLFRYPIPILSMLRSKAFVKRTRKGNVVRVIKEHYLRDDIPLWFS